MEIVWSLLAIVVGIWAIIYSNKNSDMKKDNAWDVVMSLRGYAGGLLFIIIGIYTIFKGW